MSPRQAQPALADTADSHAESSSKTSRTSPSNMRSSRRSNSALSSSRTRGSASKDDSEGEMQAGDEAAAINEAVLTMEPDEEEEGEEEEGEGESGDSSQSAAPGSISQTKTKVGSKRKRGGAARNVSRARAEKNTQPEAEEEEEEEVEVAGAEQSIKVEVGQEDMETETKEATTDAGEHDMSRSESKSGGRHTRQRSASGFKELAGLGLKSLGDGEEEPLVPRRTRRSAVSPNEATNMGDESKQDDAIGSGEDQKTSVADDTAKDEHEIGTTANSTIVQGEDETGEEGVTRCLCGSADENVGLMIQCETCKCWQHCICMGMRTEEDCPDVYFCEQCRPELHIPLLRLLGVLSTPRPGKKGVAKPQSGRVSAKDAAKELKDAKEAVLTLAKENEKRRKEGREPVTGWSVAQEIEQQQQSQMDHLQQQQHGGSRPLTGGQHRRQPSETQVRGSRSGSRDDIAVPKSPPKRRSTMNSRDSAYGWESIPPGLLNEDEEWAAKEDSEGGVRKRKRGVQAEDGEVHSASPSAQNSGDVQVKRRRTSPAAEEDDEEIHDDFEDYEGAEGSHEPSASKKATQGKARPSREQEVARPKHPNQYTARRAAAAAAAAAAVTGGGGAGGSSSPSPSPSKNRLSDGTRRNTSLREVMTNGSRLGTPTPNGNDQGRSPNSGAAWGMPDHLAHLAYLLPTISGPEPLRVNLASTKGLPSSAHGKNAPSTAVKDSKTDRIIQASPQPFQTLSLIESNSKIRFPGKRTTMGEMRKRVRNILDFVSRLQVESAERERRMKFLGISKELVKEGDGNGGAVPLKSAEEAAVETDEAEVEVVSQEDPHQSSSDTIMTEMKSTDKTQGEMEGDEQLANGETANKRAKEGVDNDEPAAISMTESNEATRQGEAQEEADSAAPATSQADAGAPSSSLERFTKLQSTSMPLVDELTRELLAFQQRYGSGTSTSAAMASSGSAY